MLASRHDSPQHGGEVDNGAGVEGYRYRARNRRGPFAVDREEVVQQPGQHGRDHGAEADEEGLHGEAACSLLGREQIGDEGAEGLHADVDGRVHHPEQPRRHPQRRHVGHRHECCGGEQGADQKVGATPAEPVPGMVAHVTDDGLDHQSRQRCREPQNRNLVRLSAEVLVDSAHVGHLQSPAELDSQEAEACVPDLPEAHFQVLI